MTFVDRTGTENAKPTCGREPLAIKECKTDKIQRSELSGCLHLGPDMRLMILYRALMLVPTWRSTLRLPSMCVNGFDSRTYEIL